MRIDDFDILDNNEEPAPDDRHEIRATGPFVMVPTWIAKHPTLSLADSRVFTVLLSHCNTKSRVPSCFVGRKLLARECRLSIRTIGRALLSLAEANLLTIKPRTRSDGSSRSNIYVLHVQEPESTKKRGYHKNITPGGARDTPGGARDTVQGTGDTVQGTCGTPLTRSHIN